MTILTDTLRVDTKGDSDILDLTPRVQALVAKHGFDCGQALVFVPGSTAGVTTIEFEPGLLEDLPAAFERIAPRGIGYRHEEAWHDGNGHSHVRASLLGPSLSVPFEQGQLLLGTWQQIVIVDFDNRPRRRDVIVQLSGEKAPPGGTA
jgi:secondary thiamine-phosphate synthase enzyme